MERVPDRSKTACYREILQRSPGLLAPLCGMEIPEADPVCSAAGYVLAPALAGFVQWILAQAKKDGIRRLYFLARDGYFPCRAARLSCEAYGISIECRYLYLSRYSLRRPLYHLDREAALHDICRNAVRITPDILLRRAGIAPEKQEGVFHALSLPYGKNQALSKADLAAIRRKMQGCPPFWDAVEHASRQAFPALAGYLRQEGLFEDVPYAIVDSGWLGSMQQSLQTLLRLQKREAELKGYYWGLYSIPAGMKRENYRCFFFDPEHHLREKVFFNNCVYEAVFSAPHGTTTGYRIQNGRFIPLLGTCPQRQIDFLHRIGEIFTQYLRLSTKHRETSFFHADFSRDKKVIGELLSLFLCYPSRAEAEAFGGLPFSDDVLEGEEQPLAAPLNEQELRMAGHPHAKLLTAAGARGKKLRESAWYEASAVLYSPHTKQHLRQYTFFKYLRHMKKALRRQKRRDMDA